MISYIEKFIIEFVSLNVNTACMFWINQPKIPIAAKKLSKVYGKEN